MTAASGEGGADDQLGHGADDNLGERGGDVKPNGNQRCN